MPHLAGTPWPSFETVMGNISNPTSSAGFSFPGKKKRDVMD
jgi:hypothetical protein